MRSIGASCLVGTPKGRLTKLEQAFLNQRWAKVRDGVQVKRLATGENVYVLAQSDARIDKERGTRRKRLRRYIERLKALQGQSLTQASCNAVSCTSNVPGPGETRPGGWLPYSDRSRSHASSRASTIS